VQRLAAELLRDARFGLRLLRKTPGFSAVAVLTLALGIAAATAIFSVVHAVYLAPLPYRDPDRLVMVWTRTTGSGRLLADPADCLEWKNRTKAFEDLDTWTTETVNLVTAERPESVDAAIATPRFLSMTGYGHPLALGRDFLEEEGTTGRDQVVILSRPFWQSRFGGDPGVIGRAVRIDGKPHVVVGVLGKTPADAIQVWRPLDLRPFLERDVRDLRFFVTGRLNPGVTLEAARANLAAATARLAADRPSAYKDWSAELTPLRNSSLGDKTRTALWLLVGAVLFVLLIACANVANLLLARGTARRRELAVRASLGASQAAIARQLLAESLSLALVASGLGMALAWGLLRVVVALIPFGTLPAEVEIRMNATVLAFSVAAGLLSAVLSGCAPAWRGARTGVGEALKSEGRGSSPGRDRLRRGLVVAEFALALALLTAGGLAVRGLVKLARVDLGFPAERLLTFSLPVPEGRLDGPEKIDAFYRQLLDRIRAVPGVRSASVSATLPMEGYGFSYSKFDVVGRPTSTGAERPAALLNIASPGYLETFGIALMKGRGLSDRDRAGSARVALVNEAFVKRFLPNVEPVGQRLAMEQLLPGMTMGQRALWEIVGVHRDVRNFHAKSGSEAEPEITLPFGQSPWPDTRVAVRTAVEPASVSRTIAAVVCSLDPDLPMAEVKTMDELVHASIAGDRLAAVLFGAFAAIALLLAAAGIYGVMSFVVSQRTREIGVRMALGAGRDRVLRDVLRDGMGTAVLGTLLGSAGAYAGARLLEGMVFGVGVIDAPVFAGVGLTLLATALAACFVPARRAASVDPAVAFRHE
jgi:putative ABC transport system permease protein